MRVNLKKEVVCARNPLTLSHLGFYSISTKGFLIPPYYLRPQPLLAYIQLRHLRSSCVVVLDRGDKCSFSSACMHHKAKSHRFPFQWCSVGGVCVCVCVWRVCGCRLPTVPVKTVDNLRSQQYIHIVHTYNIETSSTTCDSNQQAFVCPHT